MVFTSLALMLSSISLYVGSVDVSSTYSFVKEIVDNNYIHCHFVIDNIPQNTRFDIRAYMEDDTYGLQFQQCYQFSYSSLNEDVDIESFGYGYYGNQSNYSFYSRVNCRGHDGDLDYFTPMDYAYKFDDMYEAMSIDYQTIGFDYEYGEFYVDVYFYLLDVNLFEEYFNPLNNDYQDGFDNGYAQGKEDGYIQGKQEGGNSSYLEGYNEGHNDGYLEGVQSSDSYNDGYRDGYENGQNISTRDYGLINLFASIADTPILMMRSLFDFSVFGTSVLAVVLTLFTSLICLHLLKKVIK